MNKPEGRHAATMLKNDRTGRIRRDMDKVSVKNIGG